jgi:hypothetical protein
MAFIVGPVSAAVVRSRTTVRTELWSGSCVVRSTVQVSARTGPQNGSRFGMSPNGSTLVRTISEPFWTEPLILKYDPQLHDSLYHHALKVSKRGLEVNCLWSWEFRTLYTAKGNLTDMFFYSFIHLSPNFDFEWSSLARTSTRRKSHVRRVCSILISQSNLAMCRFLITFLPLVWSQRALVQSLYFVSTSPLATERTKYEARSNRFAIHHLGWISRADFSKRFLSGWGVSYKNLMQVEIGSKNHEVVPTPLIVQISGLRNGGVNKMIGALAKRNLVARVQNSKCQSRPFSLGCEPDIR